MTKEQQKNTWLSVDNNAVLDENNNLVFLESKDHIYLRAVYWAVQTLETVGYGDICAYNIHETIYCIIYFYCALFTLQITIANIVLLITSQDESRTKYADRTAKFSKYSQFRSLSKKLTDQCQAYYQHQFNILHGVDEHQFVKELPMSLQNRIMGIMIREMLSKVECLQSVPAYFLSTLAPEVQTELYFPSEIIVSAGAPATSLYIVSRGIVVKMSPQISVSINQSTSSKLKLLQTLHEGDYFGERSLYTDGEVYLLSYQSRSFCEILSLSSASFKRQCQLHLTRVERESLYGYLHNLEKNLHHPPLLSREMNGSNDEDVPDNEAQDQIIESPNNILSPSDIGSQAIPKMQFISETGVDSDSESTQGGTSIPMTKNRRVALQLDAALKLEESNFRTTWFHPNNTIMLIWRGVVAFAVLFYMFAAPLLLSVSFDKNLIQQNLPLFVLSYVTDLVVITNLLMNMFYFPFIKEGILTSSQHEIFANYKSKHSLIVDIITFLPYDIFGIFFGANLIPALRLPRLLSVLQSRRYLMELKGFSEMFKQGQLVVLIWWLFMLIHWFGCIFVIAAKISTHVFHYDTNWIITDQHSTIWHFYESDLSNMTLYFRSIYWALYSASSIGYYDILATNPVETFAVTMILLYGCQMLIGLLGGISSEMQSLTSDQILFQSKLESTQALALRKGLEPALREKLSCYFQYNWQRCRGVDEFSVFSSLPLPLRQAVVKEITGSVLRQIVFFQDCSEGILNAILASLSPRIFVDGDIVVTAGEYGTDFFVIESGCIHVTSADRSILFITLGPGNYLGESCLMGLQMKRRTASAFSQGYSYTYVLRNIDFVAAIEPYPEEGKAIIRKIKQGHFFGIPLLLISLVLDLKTTKNGNSPGDVSQDSSQSYDVPDSKDFFHPESFKRLLWNLALLFVFLYNMVLIPWRFSLDISPDVFICDYMLDLFLYTNLYLIYCKFYTLHRGIYITDTKGLQRLFLKDNFSYSYLSCIPLEIFAIFLINQPKPLILWFLILCRLSKLFLLSDLQKYANTSRLFFEKINIPYMSNVVLRMMLTVCMIGHWAACGFYLIPYYVNRRSRERNLYEGTWIESQIEMNKLPADGGDQWTRYLRSLNWAIPTLTLEVLDDIFAVNNDEMMYSLFVMFFGIILNATIIGTMISLLTKHDRESVDVQIVRQLLEYRKVPWELKTRVIRHLTFLGSSLGRRYLEEEELVRQLPFSLQVAIIEKTKLPLLNKCPLFDSCTNEAKRNLCLSLKQEIYSDGDLIIKSGDIGQEMYFLVEGNVDICNDSGVSFTILRPGSFFGETGLVFSDRRMSNVKAIGVCICYSLDRVHLDNELKVSSEVDAKTAFQSLQQLLAGNQKRNAAVSKNLALVKNSNSKLSKLIHLDSESENPIYAMLKNPYSTFCQLWDVLSLLTLLYYAISIPFHLAFLHESFLLKYKPFLCIDFLVDLFWIADTYLRYHYFDSNPIRGTLLSEENKLQHHYKNSQRFILDCFASLPIEIFASIPGTSPMLLYLLRCIHLLRVTYLMNLINLVHFHLDHLDIRIGSPVVMIIKSFTLYILGNHWIGCGYFMIHRYFERNNSITWAIMDNLAHYNSDVGHHSVCDPNISYCYLRSVYFVLSTLTSIGYGDIAPYTNLEFCYQIFVVALSGACLNALVCGSFSQYWFSVDSSSMLYFQQKMETIELFTRYRKLDDSLRDSLIGQFEYVWMLERQTGGYHTNFLTKLPPSLACEVALALRGDIVTLVPVFKLLNSGRVALGLRPQIFFKNSTVYSRGDISEDIYFIRKGSIRIILHPAAKAENTRAMYLQRNKIATMRGTFYKGSHFGEMCLLSPISLHVSTAIADVNSEVYSLSKSELWKIFLRIPRTEQRIFLIKLFTEVNGVQHSPFSEDRLSSIRLIDRTVTSTLDNLYDLSDSVLNEIIDEGVRRGNVHQTVKENEDVFYRIISKDVNDKLTCPWYEVLRVYEQKKLDMIVSQSSTSHSSPRTSINVRLPTTENRSSLRKSFENRTESTVSGDLRKRIASLFQFMDLDGTGGVSREEIHSSLQSLGWRTVSWDFVDELMEETIGRSEEGTKNKLHFEDLVEVIVNAVEKFEKFDEDWMEFDEKEE